VLVNPRIGRLLGGVKDLVRQNLPDQSCELAVVEGPAAMAERARAAAGKGYARVIVAGGDGTVGVVVRALVDSPLPLGVVPVGTHNNFAVSLGIPLDVPAACKLAVEGEPAPVDLGRVVSRQPPSTFIFKEIVGVGVDAMAFGGGVDVAGPAKIPVGALAVMSAIVSFRPHPVRFAVDGARKFIKCTQLVVANTPRYGPALNVVPEAAPNDGLLHALARTWRGRLDLLSELPHIFSGRHGDLEHDFCVPARRVLIKGNSRILMHADGEFFCRLPATVEVLPGAIQVVVGPVKNPAIVV